jgi:hypothetical protein
MPIVAITREMGSLGKDVAAGLSKALGVPLIYHEVIDPLADRKRVRKSHVVRLLDSNGGLGERLTAERTSPAIFPPDEIINFALQGRGAVIRGWGATHLLQDVPHAVCVRVCAPFEVRKQRMLDRVGSDDEGKVSEEIHNSDEAHGAIMRRNFSVQWSEPEHYDLVLNTRRVGIDECVDQIIGLVDSAEFAETEESGQRLADVALAWRARAAVRLSPRTRDVRLSVSAERGRLTLAGSVETAELRNAVNEVCAGLAGVSEIDDQLLSS